MPNPENIEPYKMKPGETLNPKGRPKGSKNLSTILREMLNEDIDIINEEGENEKKKLSEVIVRKLITKAVKVGDIKAIQVIFDRVEGRTIQTVNTHHFDEQLRKSVSELFPWKEEDLPKPEDKK